MSELPVAVYTPESSLRRPAQMAREMLGDLLTSRELAWRLTVRDLSAQYRQTALGFLWAILLPLTSTAIWLFLNRSGIVDVADTELPYPLYVFTGTMLWAIFMDAVNAPLQMTTAARAMLAKIKFPYEALVLAGIYQTLVNAGIKVVLMIAAVVILGGSPSRSLALFPIALSSLILAGTALGLLLTPLGTLYTDVGKSLPLVLQFAMYLSPVVFPIPAGGWPRAVVAWNPMTPLITTARDWLTGSSPELLAYFLVVNLLTLATLIIVWVIYRLGMPILIERMGS